MPFEKPLPVWNNPGTKPPQSKIEQGWEPNDKPPSDWFNWIFNTVYVALKELQEKGYTQDEIDEAFGSLNIKIIDHLSNKNNPHAVTKAQVGLGNVDNVKQASKADFDSHNTDSTRHITSAERTKWNAAEENAIKYAKDYGLGLISSPHLTDLDTALSNGWYSFSNTSLNNPTGSGYGVLRVDSRAASRLSQTAYILSGGTNVAIYVRFMGSGTPGWGPWTLMETAQGAQAKADAIKKWAQELGLGSAAKITTNWDNITETGMYAGSGNGPQGGTSYIGIHIQHQTTYATQTVSRNGRMFYRTKESGTWGDWIELTTQAKLDSHANNKNNPHNVTTNQVNVIPYIPASTSGNTYPVGVTTFNVEDSGLADGYPQNYGVVLNIKISHIRFTQWYFRHGFTVDTVGAYYRHWHSTYGWSEWQDVESKAGAQAKADNAKNSAINWAKSFGLGANAKVYNGDLNTLSETGFFYAGGSATNKPKGTGNGYILAQVYSATYSSQLFIAASTNDIFHRNNINNTWTAWEQLETTTGAQAKANKSLSDAKSYAMNAIAVYDGGKIDPNTTQEAYILTNHENSPGAGYWHIHTYFYSSRTSNRAQTAVSYSGSTPRMFIRHIYNGTWSAWKEIAIQSDLDTHVGNFDRFKKSVLYEEVDALTIYVNGTTGNDNNDGSQTKPLKTINAAINKVPRLSNADVVIEIAAGTYNEEIRLQSYFCNALIFSGTGNVKVQNIVVSNSTFVTFQNMELTTTADRAVINYNSIVALDNVKTVAGDKTQRGIVTYRGGFTRLTACEISNKTTAIATYEGATVHVAESIGRNNGTVFYSRGSTIHVEGTNNITGDAIATEGNGGRVFGVTQWYNLTLKNGAQAYSAENTPQYCKMGNVVHLRGALKNITALPIVIATLPANYRPTTSHPFVQNASRASGSTNFSRWTVSENGDIKLEFNSQNASNADHWHPIDTSYVIG